MYTQLYANYLLQKQIITFEQLSEAFELIPKRRLNVGTIAMLEGLITAGELDECLAIHREEGRIFIDVAEERGYLTKEQIAELFNEKKPDYLLFGQILVENGVFSYEDFQQSLFDYEQETEFYDLELSVNNNEQIEECIDRFFMLTEAPPTKLELLYLKLMFNCLIRYIGDDFVPQTPMLVSALPVTYAVSQHISSFHDYTTYIDMDRETAISFACAYANDVFTEFDEYVMASIEDFMNLHNGLFLENASNETNTEMKLSPPAVVEETVLEPESGKCIVIPIKYSFGQVNLIVLM